VFGVAVAFLMTTWFETGLKGNYTAYPVWFVVPGIAVLSLAGVKYFVIRKKYVQSFFASCSTVFTVVLTAIVGLYPNLIPSSIGAEHSLTIFNTASSTYTLTVMTVVALIFVPLVIGYQIWVHRIFRSRLNSENAAGGNAY
jgi:cytochrome d ubiquinol oxidase subunit II